MLVEKELARILDDCGEDILWRIERRGAGAAEVRAASNVCANVATTSALLVGK